MFLLLGQEKSVTDIYAAFLEHELRWDFLCLAFSNLIMIWPCSYTSYSNPPPVRNPHSNELMKSFNNQLVLCAWKISPNFIIVNDRATEIWTFTFPLWHFGPGAAFQAIAKGVCRLCLHISIACLGCVTNVPGRYVHVCPTGMKRKNSEQKWRGEMRFSCVKCDLIPNIVFHNWRSRYKIIGIESPARRNECGCWSIQI